MNCSPSIAIGLLLLALTAGTFLLYKIQKENLGIFFKIVAWFVIVVSLGCMLCCGMRCLFHGCRERSECGENRCEMQMKRCGGGHGCSMRGGMNKRIMIINEGEDDCEHDGKCCKAESGECKEKCEGGEEKKCCDKEKGGACVEKMEMNTKKDSLTVTVKKK